MKTFCYFLIVLSMGIGACKKKKSKKSPPPPAPTEEVAPPEDPALEQSTSGETTPPEEQSTETPTETESTSPEEVDAGNTNTGPLDWGDGASPGDAQPYWDAHFGRSCNSFNHKERSCGSRYHSGDGDCRQYESERPVLVDVEVTEIGGGFKFPRCKFGGGLFCQDTDSSDPYDDGKGI